VAIISNEISLFVSFTGIEFDLHGSALWLDFMDPVDEFIFDRDYVLSNLGLSVKY